MRTIECELGTSGFVDRREAEKNTSSRPLPWPFAKASRGPSSVWANGVHRWRKLTRQGKSLASSQTGEFMPLPLSVVRERAAIGAFPACQPRSGSGELRRIRSLTRAREGILHESCGRSGDYRLGRSELGRFSRDNCLPKLVEQFSMRSRTFCLLLISMSIHSIANAQMFRCKGADGRQSFQALPCAAGSTDMNPPPKLEAAKPTTVPQKRDNKPGANWDLGPRPVIPLPSSPAATPMLPAQPRPPQVAQKPRERQPGELDRQHAQQMKAEDEKALAFNRMQRCNFARQQLGVAKTARPIYRYDNKGERQYVDDENRQATVMAAERRVAEECN